jgi:hypothetical protein
MVSKALAMIVIHIPGRGVRYIERDELLWFRKAFDSEWKGALLLQLSTDRIYSTESVNDLVSKFSHAQVPVVQLTGVGPERVLGWLDQPVC